MRDEIGVPYAYIVERYGKDYVQCPRCDELFPCSNGKDKETRVAKAYPLHYRKEHE